MAGDPVLLKGLPGMGEPLEGSAAAAAEALDAPTMQLGLDEPDASGGFFECEEIGNGMFVRNFRMFTMDW
jgi:hypothetical protein